ARFIKVGDTVLVGGRGMLEDSSADDASRRKGKLVQVYPELDNGRVVADVAVANLGDFFVGERVRVWVSTDQRMAYVIPEAYIHRRYGLSYVHLNDGTEVVVQPGLPVSDGIEILSGLRNGDVLIKHPTPAGDAVSAGA
ncbi:MAG TPA: efflux transporter periplasmic adaptor subunit, partial [Porticoccaceae bacterium]|nr:efflux transporter periplasmic adaptor subunit [Porticoccaceae bacterium]